MAADTSVFLAKFSEVFLVISSSLFVICNSSDFQQSLGFVFFHIVVLIGSASYRELKELKSLQLRPYCGTGLELGCLLVPMVLASQIHLLQNDSNYHQLKDTFKYYLLVSQLMGMTSVALLNLASHQRRTMLLLLSTVALGITVNAQSDVSFTRIFSLVVLFHIFLLFLLWLFPKSFSLGEAMLIAQASLLLMIDTWAVVGHRLHYVIPSFKKPSIYVTRSIYTFWLQILFVGSLLTGFLLLPVFYFISIVRNTREVWFGHVCFYLVIVLALFSFLLPWTYLMLGGVNPFTWLIYFITYTRTRYYMIGYWCFIVVMSVVIIISQNWNGTQATTITRKYFHVLAIAVFLPGIMLETQLAHLAASVALAAFIFIEYMRLGRIKPFGELLHSSLQVFLDEKDSGSVILTHVYLLVGCAIPIWLYPLNPDTSAIALYSGILSLGIGDTLASLVGKKFGKNTWPGNKKTLEGTLAGLMAQLLFIGLLSRTGMITVTNRIAIVLCVITGSLLEAWTTQIDNLVLPPFLYSLIVIACT